MILVPTASLLHVTEKAVVTGMVNDTVASVAAVLVLPSTSTYTV